MNYQDMLAKLGVGSAHPGGFSATLEFLSHYPIRRGSKVLEVGCGTGRTSCYLAKKGLQVTGIDIREKMIEKAKQRAAHERVQVHFTVGDACNLPFNNEQFDVVFVESVTVFTPELSKALTEYHRVLKDGGQLYDREMTALQKQPQKVRTAIRKLYGVTNVPSFEEWVQLAKGAGFKEVGIWKPTAVPNDFASEGSSTPVDHFQSTDPGVWDDPQVREIIERNNEVMFRYSQYMGYGVLVATKK